MSMEFDDDSLFFKRIKDGDEAAYHELVRRTSKPLYNVAYGILLNKEDSKDAVMAAYKSLFQKRYLLQYPKGIASWLRVTVSRKAYDIIRSNKRMVFMDNDAIVDVEAETIATHVLHKDVIYEKFLVLDCMSKLTKEQREVVVLKFCGYPNRIVTEFTGLSAAQIKLLYKKAQDIFIDYYKDRDMYPDPKPKKNRKK